MSGARGVTPGAEPGLRERKKRDLRRMLSETATAMFLADGFDDVRVSDIAAACHVSAKTVYNYFPTKESLLFDRGEALAAVLSATADRRGDVVAAVVRLIDDDVERLLPSDQAAAGVAESEGIRALKAFTDLVQSKPALRGAVSEQLERLTQLAAEALAARTGTAAASPDNQIAASALIGLWQVEIRALMRFAGTDHRLDEVREAVERDIERATRLVRALFRAVARK